MSSKIECECVSKGIDPEQCLYNLSPSERGNLRKRHSKLVTKLRTAWRRVAWKINLARFKSELQRERKKLCQWYFEASSINYHCRQNDPPRVREISKLQTQFEMQHMAILHDIDKRVKPQPEQASSSSDEYDSEQDEEAVN